MSSELSRAPIGVFDSGIGGLSVLKALQATMPHENFIYFGDTANLPYGTKSPERIIELSRRIVAWMHTTLGVKMVVAACNTSSGVAAEIINTEFDIPLVWTMQPMVKAVLANPQSRNVGIIATPTSAQYKTHETFLRTAHFDGQIMSIGCPQFVPLIEQGITSGPELARAAREYLQPFHAYRLDTLIYGCTHYPLIKKTIELLLPSTVHYIDPAEHIAAEAHAILRNNRLLNTSPKSFSSSFYCSGPTDEFAAKVALLMGINNPHIAAIKP